MLAIRSSVLAVAAIVSGVAGALFTTGPAGVRAQDFESPLQFSVRQQRGSSYEREPRRVARPGLFGGFFEFFREEARPPPQRRRAEIRELKRAVCRRQCDGAQLVLGFISSKAEEKDARAMCIVAGGGAPTQFDLEIFVPGEGFEPPQMASAAPLMEGRSSASSEPAPTPRPAAMSAACPQANEPMMVPLLHDATLRKGDIVAMKGGFRVFVGKGKPPFADSDFVPVDSRRKLSRELRNLEVADR